MFLCTGYDPNGIPRTWGEGSTPDVAHTRCLDAAKTYLTQKKRPDVKPLDKWRFRVGAAS